MHFEIGVFFTNIVIQASFVQRGISSNYLSRRNSCHHQKQRGEAPIAQAALK